jgi:curved DNA-binding protein CbpA
MAHETTLYSVLRVSEDASPDEIKQAYRRLVKLWHPDLHPDDMSAEKRMAEINEAYTVLSDQAKKWKYDESLSRKRAQLKAKQEEQARREAAAAAAVAAAKASAAVKNQPAGAKPYRDPDWPRSTNYSNPDSSYEDFTKTPFVVYGNDNRPVQEKPARSNKVSTTEHTAVEQLSSGEKRLEDLSIAMCVIFPVLIPIVHKHVKESLEIYPKSRHYQDAMTSLRIVTVFAVPLWALIISLVIRAVLGIHA